VEGEPGERAGEGERETTRLAKREIEERYMDLPVLMDPPVPLLVDPICTMLYARPPCRTLADLLGWVRATLGFRRR
jgi:hypothetical protein